MLPQLTLLHPSGWHCWGSEVRSCHHTSGRTWFPPSSLPTSNRRESDTTGATRIGNLQRLGCRHTHWLWHCCCRAEIIDVPLQICHPWDLAQSKMEDPGEGGHILRINEAEQPEWNTRHHDALKRREQSLQYGVAASKSIKPTRSERPHSAPTKRSQKGVPRNGKSTHSGLAQHSIGTREVLAAALGHSQIGHNLSGENKPLNAILHAKWF